MILCECNEDCYFQHEGFCCIDDFDYVENLIEPDFIENCNLLSK